MASLTARLQVPNAFRLVVWVELVAVGVLVALDTGAPVPVTAAVGGALVVVPLLPLGGRTVVMRCVLAAGFLLRRHAGSTGSTADDARGRSFGEDRPNRDRRSTTGSSRSTSRRPAADDPPENAVLSGLVGPLRVVRETTDDGAELGIAAFRGHYIALFAVEPVQEQLIGGSLVGALPLDVLGRHLSAAAIPVDAIQVLSRRFPPAAALPPASPVLAATRALTASLPNVPRGDVLLALRLDPRDAMRAVQARGGGTSGVARCLAATAARISSALGPHQLALRALTRAELTQAVAVSCGLTVGEQATAWRESLRSWRSGELSSRSYALTGLAKAPDPGAALDQVWLTGAPVVATSVTLSRRQVGPPALTVAVRITAPGPNELAAANTDLRQACRSAGLRLHSLAGAQRSGLLATVPLGGAA